MLCYLDFFLVYVHLPHALLLCISYISGSSSQAGYSRKKFRPNEEIESEEEEILPTTRTARQQQLDKQKLPKGTTKKVVKTPVRKPQPRKPPPPITFDKMRSHLYREYRDMNPYSTPRNPHVPNPFFYTSDQERVYNDIYLNQKTKVTKQHSLDIDHMKLEKHHGYFDEALSLCEEYGLINIMTLNQRYDDFLIAQFFSTVHFDNDEKRTLRWMTKDTVLEATLEEFGNSLGYTLGGWTCHGGGRPMSSDVLAPITLEDGTPGETDDLIPTYEIMHRIYRETLAPRVGNTDQVHAFVIDLMYWTFTKQGSHEELDVMNFIYNELHLAVIDKRAPVFGTYVMRLIRDCWARAKNGERIDLGVPLTDHPVKQLRVKKPKSPKKKIAAAGPSAPIEEPSWLKKLNIKLKKSFCLKLDIEEHMYDAHCYHKKAARRQKEMMKKMGHEVSSGSEGTITPKEQWLSKHRNWDDDDEAVPPPGSDTHPAA